MWTHHYQSLYHDFKPEFLKKAIELHLTLVCYGTHLPRSAALDIRDCTCSYSQPPSPGILLRADMAEIDTHQYLQTNNV